MLSKKILVTFISISLAVHIVILAIIGIIDVRGNNHREVFTVDLKKPPKDYEETANKKRETNLSRTGAEDKIDTLHEREDTINLDSMNIKYRSYLKKLRDTIRRNWSYPKEAYIRKKEGITVAKFSITESGSLCDFCIITSSGFESLDMETLHVIKSSAPYAPLPKNFNLTKLNIVANFQYRLFD